MTLSGEQPFVSVAEKSNIGGTSSWAYDKLEQKTKKNRHKAYMLGKKYTLLLICILFVKFLNNTLII